MAVYPLGGTPNQLINNIFTQLQLTSFITYWTIINHTIITYLVYLHDKFHVFMSSLSILEISYTQIEAVTTKHVDGWVVTQKVCLVVYALHLQNEIAAEWPLDRQH